MRKKGQNQCRVVFWHNDFPDGSRQNSYYGKNGSVCKLIAESLKPGIELKWHFHGGYITPARTNLLRRLEMADVLFTAYPWNMDMDDSHMTAEQAGESLLRILTEIKEKNPGLKIFFLHEPHDRFQDLQALGQFVNDLHEKTIYDYFSKR